MIDNLSVELSITTNLFLKVIIKFSFFVLFFDLVLFVCGCLGGLVFVLVCLFVVVGVGVSVC